MLMLTPMLMLDRQRNKQRVREICWYRRRQRGKNEVSKKIRGGAARVRQLNNSQGDGSKKANEKLDTIVT